MVNEELRKYLEENHPDSVIFDNPAFDNSVVGISTDGNLIYDIEQMTEELSKDDNISAEEALEFIDYNTVRILPYIYSTAKPIIVDFSIKELYNLDREER